MQKRKPSKPIRFHRDTLLFHHSIRIGRKGKPIRISKFRTMKRDAVYGFSPHDITGRGRLLANDARVTKLGKLLRRFHVDELPQIWNLLKGELSLVGIRPMSRQEYRGLPEEIKKIHTEMGPGLAGLAYACKTFPPTERELFDTFREFYALWKISPVKAQLVFGVRIAKNKLLGRAPSV
ncbi:MAG: sugar transferase [Candidatus Diapherotrites archaeon]|nr:sugar transferase [Candidatus Diapherotrites archaeon]